MSSDDDFEPRSRIVRSVDGSFAIVRPERPAVPIEIRWRRNGFELVAARLPGTSGLWSTWAESLGVHREILSSGGSYRGGSIGYLTAAGPNSLRVALRLTVEKANRYGYKPNWLHGLAVRTRLAQRGQYF